MNNIKNARNACGMTQQYVADTLQVTRVTYARYESGEREPTFRTLIQMSRMFGVTVDYLVGNTEPFVARQENQAITAEEQELLQLWRSADKASREPCLKLLKAYQPIYEERETS